jgi:hypothetical protein
MRRMDDPARGRTRLSNCTVNASKMVENVMAATSATRSPPERHAAQPASIVPSHMASDPSRVRLFSPHRCFPMHLPTTAPMESPTPRTMTPNPARSKDGGDPVEAPETASPIHNGAAHPKIRRRCETTTRPPPPSPSLRPSRKAT